MFITPNLGVAFYDPKEVTVADIPGLVEGAHKGIGLGDKFLRHIERCKVLLHLIDLTSDDLEDNYLKISCSNKSIKVKDIQREGKRPQNVNEFVLGSQIKKGTNLSDA